MLKALTFDDAITESSKRYRRRAVLLGNGFSMDYDPTIFGYQSLAEEASLTSLSIGKSALFESMASSNFEVVVERLRSAARAVRLYDGDESLAQRLEADAQVVRNGLADALADRHPARSTRLTIDEVRQARGFLSHFDRIFTLNYDLLLYWLINRRETPGDSVVRRDGFGPVNGDLVWKRAAVQRVFFLHGGLHLFRENRRIRKLTYWGDGPLIEGLRERLALGTYPHIVTEGTSDEKRARIDRSPFLRTQLDRFGSLHGALFLHGVSLSPNDDHVFEQIESKNCAIEALYVGLRDPKKAKFVVERAREVKQNRKENGGRKIRLRFYTATSANVWRPPV